MKRQGRIFFSHHDFEMRGNDVREFLTTIEFKKEMEAPSLDLQGSYLYGQSPWFDEFDYRDTVNKGALCPEYKMVEDPMMGFDIEKVSG